MTDADVAAVAERLSRKRARMLPVLAIFFIGQQAVYFSGTRNARTVDHLHIAGWVVLSAVLLLILATGGGWFQPRAVRDRANDEVTRAHRGAALALGFFAAMLTGIGLYVLDQFEPMTAAEAIHLIMTIGIAAALIRFGMLERRASRDG